MTLRFGLKLAQDAPVESFQEVWRTADEAGFDHVWVMDHIASLGADPTRPIFDAWALQAAMAVGTSRVRIGCMVTGNSYRHPGMLAKLATTVDHLSGGRLEFGIGAGWNEREHEMYGLDLGSVRTRMDRLEESLQILRSLWTAPTTTFHGEHYHLTAAVAEPKPVQRPHPPIWIGGSGPRRTLRLVAQHADAWNDTSSPPERLAELGQVLDRHCADVGRDPAAIRRTVQLRLREHALGDLAPLVERYAALGVSEFVVVLPPEGDLRAHLDDVVAELPRLRTAG
ncbi:LLM class F420-dependent oxidoreductase [Isoptericola dokdonensis]|uniref:Phthiodiolone/phenolphthiodiolone dimycocerosates ketoreductase n=1 Tax=Isoptericola dokdonensis DS-3 TaxID=1300344 RepID=A0A161IJB4_9MICO|nr:LLM class F420-dependent oxidoreductase [Isoptericola dokdonensis]ANC30260.1 Phthiodiolone/phenolphthiodiolone dimycocerosates ketoreductase [Isoptericola dokdonensis DS-3]